MKVFLLVVVLIFILLIAAMLGAKNDQVVAFDYLYAVMEMRLSLLLMAFFTAGVALTSAVFMLIWLKLKWRVGKLEKHQRKIVLTDSKTNA